MITKEEIIFSIEKPARNFQRHLSEANNPRIVFSGPFGSGKTTFLKKFFNSHDEYNVIHLYPVNYSIANNEDIFQLIKYDILYQLLSDHKAFESKSAFNTSDYFSFLAKHQDEFYKLFLGIIPKLGKSVKEIIASLEAMHEKLEVEKKNASMGEYAHIESFMKQIEQGDFSYLYENDIITNLIRSGLENILKENATTEQNVLILDDLDRIDPEHIFRLLNIFAAHVDVDQNANKFGFDKIILITDWSNIKNIFVHKYGPNVDFNGYLDKFYSQRVFEFNNVNEVLRGLENIFISIKGESGVLLEMYNQSNILGQYVRYLTELLLLEDKINLRSIFSVHNTLLYSDYFNSNENEYPWLEVIIQFMSLMIGTRNEAIHKLISLKENTFWSLSNTYRNFDNLDCIPLSYLISTKYSGISTNVFEITNVDGKVVDKINLGVQSISHGSRMKIARPANGKLSPSYHYYLLNESLVYLVKKNKI